MGFRSGLLAGQSLINAVLFAVRKFSVPSCMVCGIIMPKKNDIGIILKQWDNMSRKNFTSVALGIQIPFNNDEISAKATCNALPDQDQPPPPTVGITLISPIVY